MPLIHAYRIVKGDQIKGTPAKVERTEILNDDEVEIYFATSPNTVSRTFKQDSVLTVSARTEAIRPKYKPGQRKFGV